MVKKKSEKESTEKLLEIIIEAIKNKKGKEIVSIDLRKIENSVCEFFIICSGDSSTQIGAITDGIKEKTRELADVSPHHTEGLKNSLWVLMDYINIVIHIFIPEQRAFYQLEELWADGKITKHQDD